jgi:hypothetical protein
MKSTVGAVTGLHVYTSCPVGIIEPGTRGHSGLFADESRGVLKRVAEDEHEGVEAHGDCLIFQ